MDDADSETGLFEIRLIRGYGLIRWMTSLNVTADTPITIKTMRIRRFMVRQITSNCD